MDIDIERNKIFICLKWTSIISSLMAITLFIVLIVYSVIDKKDTEAIRIIMGVFGGVGLCASLCGAFGAFKHKFILFVIFNIFVSLNAFFGINFKNVKVFHFYWYYPVICFALFLPLTFFAFCLGMLRVQENNQ